MLGEISGYALARDASPEVARDGAFTLPLVSVIIVNHNYGRFLRQSVTSVAEQVYPNIECIIVDNASTDNSGEVLRSLHARYKNLTILRRTENLGQCAAAIDGYNASSGKYVVFLDADDALLPDFAATHVLVHLSLRKPVGFTSSDMLQADGNEIVVGTFQHLSRAIRDRKSKQPSPVRPFERACPRLWDTIEPNRAWVDDVVTIPATDLEEWVWSPTSGNCFRRDALDLFLNCEALPSLKYALDTYLIRAIHAITGSALIDRPLAIYRIHGGNIFSKAPHLSGLISYNLDNADYKEQLSRKLIIDHIISRYRKFQSIMYDPRYICTMLRKLNDIHPPLRTEDGANYCRQRLMACGEVAFKDKLAARTAHAATSFRKIFDKLPRFWRVHREAGNL